MKLDIIFAGAAKDEQQEKLLLDLLSPLGIDKHTMTEAKSDRKAMESALVTALRRSDVVLLIGGLGSGRSDFTTPLLCEGLGLREEICPAAVSVLFFSPSGRIRIKRPSPSFFTTTFASSLAGSSLRDACSSEMPKAPPSTGWE